MHEPKEIRTKIDWTSKLCILVGYEITTTQYRLWCPENKRMYVSRDVRFVESERPARQLTKNTQRDLTLEEPELRENELPPVSDDQSDSEELEDDHCDMEVNNNEDLEAIGPKVGNNNEDLEAIGPKVGNVQALEGGLESEPPSDLAKNPKTPEEPKTQQQESVGEMMVDVPLRKSRRIRRLTQKAEQIQKERALSADYAEIEPETFDEAVNDPVHGNAWKEAIKSELDSLAKNKTFTLIKRSSCPADRKLVTCKWCFEFKRDVTGKIIRHKARLVARGVSQRPGIDYFETFAPVAEFTTLRILLMLAAAADWEIHQMDVKTAFLYGDLEAEIYMELPEGIGIDNKDLVCRLHKSLYGLKQAPRIWNQKLHAFLTSKNLKLVRTEADHSLYVGNDLVIAVYVDDLKIAARGNSLMEQVKVSLAKEFEMKDLGEINHYLGMQIIRDREARTIHINQRAYVSAIIKRAGMENCNAVQTPMIFGQKLELGKAQNPLPIRPNTNS